METDPPGRCQLRQVHSRRRPLYGSCPVAAPRGCGQQQRSYNTIYDTYAPAQPSPAVMTAAVLPGTSAPGKEVAYWHRGLRRRGAGNGAKKLPTTPHGLSLVVFATKERLRWRGRWLRA
jgi:hypothetical protein